MDRQHGCGYPVVCELLHINFLMTQMNEGIMEKNKDTAIFVAPSTHKLKI